MGFAEAENAAAIIRKIVRYVVSQMIFLKFDLTILPSA